MIRNVGKKIKISETVVVEKTVTKEIITAIFIRPELKVIDITIGLLDGTDREISKRFASISENDYDLLFSTDDFFETGKQTGSYREVDLWKVIDKVSIDS